MTIKDAIQQLAGTAVHALAVGTVSAVEGQLCSITPQDGGAEILDARLGVVEGQGAGWIVVPGVGSLVLFGWLDNEGQQAVVLSVATPASATFDVAGKLVLNGGANGGLVVGSAVSDQLNRIESKINALISVINGWTPVPNDGGAALKLALAAWLTSNLAPLTASADLENPNITH